MMDDPIPELVEELSIQNDDANNIDTEFDSQDGVSVENQDGEEDEEMDHAGLEEMTQTSEEIREEMVNDLENFEFPEEASPEDDTSGRLAYRKKCEQFDFFMFPVDSVIQKFDSEALLLAHCGLGDKGAIALAESLKVNTTVTELSVVDNWITPVGGQHLLEAINQNPSITKVDFSENRLGYRAALVGGPSIGESLNQLLAQNSNLKSITLRANKLGDADIVQVAEALCENFTLHSIDLSYNEMGPRGGEAIGAMLSSNGDLMELNLEWNPLRNEGTLKVLEGLKQNNVLKKISLAWNGLSDKGGVAVGDVLLTNTSLEEVDVSHNHIGAAGAKRIAEGIADNAAIRTLILGHNPLGDEGCAAILAAVSANQSLIFVDLKAAESGMLASRTLPAALEKRGSKVQILLTTTLSLPSGRKS